MKKKPAPIDRFIAKSVKPLPPPRKVRKFRWRWVVAFLPYDASNRYCVCRSNEEALFQAGQIIRSKLDDNPPVGDFEVEVLRRYVHEGQWKKAYDLWNEEATDEEQEGKSPLEITKVKYYFRRKP
jgi:hypothetical protein